MKKLLATSLSLCMLASASQAMAALANVDIVDDGYYFHGPFAGAQMWVPEEITFRNHGSFDAQGYVKFDIAGDLAGITAADINSATLTWSTYHMKEDIPNMQWKSPSNGYGVNLRMSPYASAVDMTLTVEPGIVSGTSINQSHTVFDIAGAADRTYLEDISMDITAIVKSWVGGTYGNYGIKMDITGAPAGEKFYMRAFAMEELGGARQARLTVDYDAAPVPIPGALWLLGSGIAGLVGLQRRKKM